MCVKWVDGPWGSGAMHAEPGPQGHGWNSCRCLVFSGTFLVLQLFDPLEHDGSQREKTSTHSQSVFSKEADGAGAGGGVGSGRNGFAQVRL